MQLALRPFTTAAVALAGAALVAATPPVIKAVQLQHPTMQHPAVQLIDVSQQIADLGQSEITSGLALYNQGDWAVGLNEILIGENNAYLAAPQDALLAQIETASQPFEYVYSYQDPQLPIPTDESQLSANLQLIYEIGQNLVNQGNSDLAAGALNLGLAETTRGTDDLTVFYPEEALYGPLYISFASQQLTNTVAGYEQQYIESVFQIAANSSTPPPVPSVPPVDFGLQQDLAKLGTDLVALKDALNTDIIPGVPVTDQTLLDLLPGGLEVHALEGASLAGTLLDPTINVADKITEGISFLQSIFTP